VTARPGARSERLRSLAVSPATGALVAQVWQAGTSFAIQVVAAHVLGARGLGVVALCLGVVVLTTAVTSGFVGDALTVLDRHRADIRAGLQVWALALTLTGPTIAAGVLRATGLLDGGEAWLFLSAAVLFQLEEVARRILMATLRFWRLLVVDSVALAGSVTVLVVVGALGAVTLGSFLAAVSAGQLAGLVVAVSLAPSRERRLVRLSGAAVRGVASFGVWRGTQVGVNPGVFTGMRVLVVALAGSAALGQLEAARIYVAPAVLAIQGFGSYLLASYARDSVLPLAVLVARARRSALALAGAAAAVGLVLWAATPVVGPWVTGGSFAMPAAAVLGWALYAAATATSQPFVSLAAARGRQRAALGVRLLDGSLSLGAVGVLVAAGAQTAWTPFALALGPFLGGVVVRAAVLAPMTRAGESARATTSPVGSDVPVAPSPRFGEVVHHAQ
jgi:O-antigen/teichoic acid export membrane protein